jgi:hypothetical protein
MKTFETLERETRLLFSDIVKEPFLRQGSRCDQEDELFLLNLDPSDLSPEDLDEIDRFGFLDANGLAWLLPGIMRVVKETGDDFKGFLYEIVMRILSERRDVLSKEQVKVLEDVRRICEKYDVFAVWKKIPRKIRNDLEWKLGIKE